jgi:hypothetical protein
LQSDGGEVEEAENSSGFIQATVNSYTALQCLRHQNSERTIWADALCIEQADLVERSEQVVVSGHND